MQARFLLLAVLLCPAILYPQYSENFSDGNFSSEPQWLGDTANFKITSSSAVPPGMKPSLQLDGTASGTAVLYLLSEAAGNAEWHFWVKLSFNTSANNFARFYPVSDQADLTGPLNGYFIQAGGADDSIGFYRQEGGETLKLIQGITGYTGNTTNTLRFKLVNENSGTWKLFSDITGGNNFAPEGECVDTTIASSQFSGIFCRYTSSNAQKFYFDDFYCGPAITDTLPPGLKSTEVISEIQVKLVFSEEVETTSASNIAHYTADHDLGHPVGAEPVPGQPAEVLLTFQDHFQPNIQYLLEVNNISDLNGNILLHDEISFLYGQPLPAQPFDLVVSEIMTDVNPAPAGLPEADYLELFNRSGQVINLKDWTVKPRISGDPVVFPEMIFQPDSFLIVTTTSAAPEFAQYGQVSGLPGFSLNNEGTIVLRDHTGQQIHSVSYTSAHYHDPEKEDGGWSMEMKDPEQPCIGSENWAASTDGRGGTPGTVNSVNQPVNSAPEISNILSTGELSLRVEFSHIMDPESILNPLAYQVTPGSWYPSEVLPDTNNWINVTLLFQTGFSHDQWYELRVADTLADCAGNTILPGQTAGFPVPLDAGPYDILINEIMADPEPPVGLFEYEFIELYNRTNEYRRLKNCLLMVGTVEKPVPEAVIPPEGYLIITDDDAVLLFSMYGQAAGLASMGLSNAGAALTLLDSAGKIISFASYNDEMYQDESKAEGGWSFELTDPDNPCPGITNWKVSVAEYGGTPGALNSVYSPGQVFPNLISAIPEDQNTLLVTFSDRMKKFALADPMYYWIEPEMWKAESAVPDSMDPFSTRIKFDHDFQNRRVYTLRVQSVMFNECGLQLQSNEVGFGMPEEAAARDVIINEILFNPAGDGEDYVEVYNRSEKIIALDDLYLGSVEYNPGELPDTNFYKAGKEQTQLLPGGFMVFTPDVEKVKSQYTTHDPDCILKMSPFPQMNNDAGVVLISSHFELTDIFHYDEKMHYPLLQSNEGVSLERISYAGPTEDATNWHSAAETAGFGTPGYVNSQFAESGAAGDPVKVEPESFSPDNDGNQDVTEILYRFGQPGYNGSISIFDANGRLVRSLIRNTLLGTEGSFAWDGIREDRQRAQRGIYIILFEVFAMDGRVKQYKKVVVVM